MKLCDLVLTGPRSSFAEYYATDVPWKDPKAGCPKCFRPVHRERTGPSTIMFEPGSDIVPDFLAAYAGFLRVTERVKTAFEEAGLTGYVAWPIKVQEPKKLPKRDPRPRVPSPYPGPPLWEIYVTEYVHLIPELSSLDDEGICPECGWHRYRAAGAAESCRYAVDRTTWSGADFMRPVELNGIFVTERVANLVRENNFTNVEIWQRAEIVDPPPGYVPLWVEEEANRAKKQAGSKKQDEPELQYDEDGLPADNETLARTPITLDDAKGEDASTCPAEMPEILEYLEIEMAEECEADDLEFIRTARLEDKVYWIWRTEDEAGEEVYVSVSRSDAGQVILGCYDNDEGFTPEQYIFGEHHEYF